MTSESEVVAKVSPSASISSRTSLALIKLPLCGDGDLADEALAEDGLGVGLGRGARCTVACMPDRHVAKHLRIGSLKT